MQNETEHIIFYIIELLYNARKIPKDNVKEMATYFGLSKTAIYNMISKDRITIKFFKKIKMEQTTKDIEFNDNYLINHILLGV